MMRLLGSGLGTSFFSKPTDAGRQKKKVRWPDCLIRYGIQAYTFISFSAAASSVATSLAKQKRSMLVLLASL